jgi:magnesium-transporting ATPase (P-type)
MAKKRKIKRIVRPKIKPSIFANVLVIATIVLLFLAGIAALAYTDSSLKQIQDNLPGVTMSKSSLITFGITWMILALLILITNSKIRESFRLNLLEDQSWMWFLLVISVVSIFFLGIFAGFLVLIASIIYLVHARKLLNRK